MTRTKSDQSISSAGWRRLLRIALVLAAAFDLYLYQGGARWCSSSNYCIETIIPQAHAASRDQTIRNSHPPRHQQNQHAIRSNCHESCTDPSFRTLDRSRNSEVEGTLEKVSQRRQRDIRPLKIFGRNPLRIFVTSKRREKHDYLRETTRIVGGANLNTDVDKEPQQLVPEDVENMPMIPQSDIQRRFQRTLVLTHKVVSQAGPAMITLLSLLYFNNGKKDEISLLTLYTLALLGASCGFHLFLHFITLGYALGVTLPLIVALSFYQVRVSTFLHIHSGWM